MAIDASDESAPHEEAHVVWFRVGGNRPVNGSGNTVFVRPADAADEQPTSDDA